MVFGVVPPHQTPFLIALNRTMIGGRSLCICIFKILFRFGFPQGKTRFH